MDKKTTQPPTLLGRNIKYLRVRKGLTQIELAEELGIGIATLGNIESGFAGTVLATTLEALSDALGASMDDLVKVRLWEREPLPAKKRRGPQSLDPSYGL